MRRIALVLSLLLSAFAYTQNITQTIRGTIVDKETFQPLIGAKVILIGSDPLIGSVTDLDGKFRLDSVPVGKQSILVKYVGYDDYVQSNIEVGPKEIILNIEVVESVKMMNKVDVVAKKKGETINKMATVSIRSFSIEESNRYAGSLNDVARMARNYAGVQGADDSRNDIIIRGNSPTGLLYRMEGLDIPNPNHFARFGTTGGPVSMLNNNVLANSDFLTGAFPAEYGNAVAGVFDLKMRTGNNEKHEFMFQFGFNGAEAMAEGPISRKTGASYLINYRYSTLKLFQLMGINFGSTALPNYQDASFKFNFPHKKGVTSIWGVGGFSNIDILAENVDSTDLYAIDKSNTRFDSKMGVVGLTHKHRLDKKSYLRLSAGFHSSLNFIKNDTVDDYFENPFETYLSNTTISKQSTDIYYNRKFNAKHTLKIGFHSDFFFMDMNDSAWSYMNKEYYTIRDFKGNTFLWQPYVQHQWRPFQRTTINLGFHLQGLSHTGEVAPEPRLGVAFTLTEKDRLSIGYGLHSQAQPLEMYFQNTSIGSWTTQTNRNVGFTKSHHLILGYQHRFPWGVNFKTEAYYQYLFNVPVESQSSAFSMLNFGAAFDTTTPDSLVNNGTGRNYGIEFTLEKYLDKGFYFMITSSFYQSFYTPSNGIEYHSAFDGLFTFNALSGYEYKFKQGKRTQASMTFDLNFTLNGGKRYTPVLIAESDLAGVEIKDWTQAYSKNYQNYIRGDFKVGFKMVGKNITQQWSVDLQNFTNKRNIFLQEYDPEAKQMQTTYQTGFLPIVQYRLYF